MQGRERAKHPIIPKKTAPQYQPIEIKKTETVEDKKGASSFDIKKAMAQP